MSSSWGIQEDHFDDVDSEDDDRLSYYGDDFYIEEQAEDNLHPPRMLSTIAEEPSAVEGGVSVIDSVLNKSFAGMELADQNVEALERSSQFRREVRDILQRDQESFFRHKLLDEDDWRFNKSHFEKENSWEPSVHSSLPPAPKINVDDLAASSETDSHILPVTLPKRVHVQMDMDVENTPPASHMQQKEEKCGWGQNNDSNASTPKNKMARTNEEPKMSTPNSFDSGRSLRDLSINCISAINPDQASPKVSRGRNFKSGGSVVTNKISTINDEQSLSSSAIARVISSDDFFDDSILIKALLTAKRNPRLKLNFPETTTGVNDLYKQPTVTNESTGSRKVLTKHDRSGITNKTKRLKTIQELNSLRLPSQESTAIRHLAPNSETERASGSLTPQTEWKPSVNSNTATVSPFPSSSKLFNAEAESHGKFLSCDRSLLYFGFVQLKCRVNRTLRLRNISSKSLNLRLQLQSTDRGYELMEHGIIMLKSQETYIVHIVFQPPFGACFRNVLHITVLNAEHITYSIPLIGSGGVAALLISAHAGLRMLRDGSFVLTTQGVTNISFDVENKGLRDAFVRLIVLDKETKRTINGCTVTPSDCVCILRRDHQKFDVEVPSVSADENNGKSNRTFPTSLITPSVAGSAHYYVQLLWGEEAQRRRLKRYESEKRADWTFSGYTFTKCSFLNEEKCKISASEDAAFGLYDREAFELGVVDNRLSMATQNHFSREPLLAESVILEPDANISPVSSNRSVVEDISTLFPANRLL